MKKYDIKFILIEIFSIIAASVLIGFLISFLTQDDIETVLNMGVFFVILLLCFFTLGLFFFGNNLIGMIAKKTMEKKSEEINMNHFSSFKAEAQFTVGSLLRIDAETGRIAYVSYQNPFECQVVSAKDITDIKSDYIKGPFGGTRYVYFEFYYNNKRVRIPTFTSRNMYSLKSREVLEGISKGDTFCDILVHAKNVAM